MANKYGKNYAKTIAFPPEKVSMVESLGKLYSSYDEFDLASVAVTSGDLIYMMKIPMGAIIVNAVLLSDALAGASLAVGVIAPGKLEEGAGTSVAELIPTTAIAASPVIVQMTAAVAPLMFVKTTAETQIGIKATATGTATTGKIKLMVIFAMS